ncbi:MAG: type II toxin-antitoxin system MqsA family antitoxin [Lachnospiraceae bacterium]
MCKRCFLDDKLETKTTFTVEYNDCIIVIKNVPCLECPICGEITFKDEVSEKLEKLVEAAKQIMQDISVIDYSKAA